MRIVSLLGYPSKHLLAQTKQQNTRKRCEICFKLIIKTTYWDMAYTM